MAEQVFAPRLPEAVCFTLAVEVVVVMIMAEPELAGWVAAAMVGSAAEHLPLRHLELQIQAAVEVEAQILEPLLATVVLASSLFVTLLTALHQLLQQATLR